MTAAGDRVEPLVDEHLDRGCGRPRFDTQRALQQSLETEIVTRALADGDAEAGAIHRFILCNRRIRSGEICAFDRHTGRRERDLFGAPPFGFVCARPVID
jgi:hypothetical protein